MLTAEPTVPEVLHVWTIFVRAGEEARRRRDRQIGTDHILLALLDDPSIEVVLGVHLEQARQAIESLDHEAVGLQGVASGTDAPLPMHAVPKKPTVRAIMRKKSLRMTPAAKSLIKEAVNLMHRTKQVSAQQVLTQVLAVEPPDPAAMLLVALDVNVSQVRLRLNAITPDG